jgi:hypothetical protein
MTWDHHPYCAAMEGSHLPCTCGAVFKWALEQEAADRQAVVRATLALPPVEGRRHECEGAP